MLKEILSIDARKRLFEEINQYSFISSFDYFKLGTLYTLSSSKDDNDIIDQVVDNAKKTFGDQVTQTVVDYYNENNPLKRNFHKIATKNADHYEVEFPFVNEKTIAFKNPLFVRKTIELLSFWMVDNNQLYEELQECLLTELIAASSTTQILNSEFLMKSDTVLLLCLYFDMQDTDLYQILQTIKSRDFNRLQNLILIHNYACLYMAMLSKNPLIISDMIIKLAYDPDTTKYNIFDKLADFDQLILAVLNSENIAIYDLFFQAESLYRYGQKLRRKEILNRAGAKQLLSSGNSELILQTLTFKSDFMDTIANVRDDDIFKRFILDPRVDVNIDNGMLGKKLILSDQMVRLKIALSMQRDFSFYTNEVERMNADFLLVWLLDAEQENRYTQSEHYKVIETLLNILKQLELLDYYSITIASIYQKLIGQGEANIELARLFSLYLIE
jgi:hypothetical protein